MTVLLSITIVSIGYVTIGNNGLSLSDQHITVQNNHMPTEPITLTGCVGGPCPDPTNTTTLTSL